tara:strand:- start:416 stop:2104 length:1689 start_codon:yes stop_codon:yes gene_type:complete
MQSVKSSNEYLSKLNTSLRSLYDNTSYWGRNGMDILVTIFILFVFIILICYFYVLSIIYPIKTNWGNHKCNPFVLPFAGFIYKKDGMTSSEFTSMNFNQCTMSILERLSKFSFQPFYYVLNIFKQQFTGMSSSVNSIRDFLGGFRNVLGNTANLFYNQFEFIIIPIFKLIHLVTDFIQKLYGLLILIYYKLISAYMILVNFFKILRKLIIRVLIMIAVAIGITVGIGLALMASLFGFIPGIALIGVALAMLIIFVIILIPAIIIIIFLKKHVHIQSKKPPKKPFVPGACFDADTKIKLQNNKLVPIKKIKIGDILEDNSYVTSVLKFSSYNRDLFTYNNIIVSGDHRVYDDILGLIRIDNHPDSISIDDYREPYIYCINTSSKNIIINNTIFTDWDNIDKNDIIDLHFNCCDKGLLPHNFSKKDIHSYLNAGFHGDSILHLDDGRSIKIKDVEVNDVLKHGENVLGIVRVYAYDMNGIYEYYLDNNTLIKCSKNIEINTNLGSYNTSSLEGNKIDNITYAYHLITDKRSFIVDNVNVMDYNYTLNKFLRKSIHKFSNLNRFN